MRQRVDSAAAVPGETYFFRDPAIFQLLATEILPALVRDRRGRDRRLRLWSAGCASGEEAYSLAIVVRQVVPDLADWQLTILATDNNEELLRKARPGVYGEWSFRGVPTGVKALHFERTRDQRYAVNADVRKLVTFNPLNLVHDVYPSLHTGTTAFDIVLCRNVLMYFTPAQVRAVVRKLREALVPGGWLIVSPAETSQEIFSELETVVIEGRTFYRRADAPVGEPAAPPEPFPAAIPDPEASSPVVRRLANEGRLDEALAECDRWIAAHKLDPIAYYLRAVVLIECGRADDARRSLQQAIFLDPAFVLAHFALGTLARQADKPAEARRHFANTRRMLQRLRPGELLPESDGLPAGRLSEIVAELTRDA